MTEPASVALYWIPLGAGGHSVRFNGKVYEAIMATLGRRSRYDLYHAALIVELDGQRNTIEVAPSPDGAETSRGVVGTGAVGSRPLGWLRMFRYEVRCCAGGTIPDLDYAVAGPSILTSDPMIARNLVRAVSDVPRPVWGRDELDAGEMWNSNSVISWVIASSGLPTAQIHPPPHGRAPGWQAGLTVASRDRCPAQEECQVPDGVPCCGPAGGLACGRPRDRKEGP